MKKGISIWAFGDMPLAKAFSLAKHAGFEGIELALAENGELHLEVTKEDVLKIKELAAKNGLILYSLATGLYWDYSLTSEHPEIRLKALNIAKKQIEIASWLGCDTILIVPGAVNEHVAYDIAYERALSAVKSLAALASSFNVVLGIENVWNNMLLSPLEMVKFINEADSSHIKAYFDVGNVVREGYPEQWIRILGKAIAKVHFKDYKRSVGTLSGFVDLLKGDVDYPAVMTAFSEIGYDNWVTAELFPEPSTNIQVWIQEISDAMSSILSAK